MIYCKTLDPAADYITLKKEIAHVLAVKTQLSTRRAVEGFPHPHRVWEYALALRALADAEVSSATDVGGGASVFAPAYAMRPGVTAVRQVDPSAKAAWAKRQMAVIVRPLKYVQIDFLKYSLDNKDQAIVSISVLEHVQNHRQFFTKLAQHVKPGGLLVVTFDFHPSGKAKCKYHLRTYNQRRVTDLINLGVYEGLEVFGDGLDYTWRGPAVFDYTFASLTMRRKNCAS